jgi:hypothetical protein
MDTADVEAELFVVPDWRNLLVLHVFRLKFTNFLILKGVEVCDAFVLFEVSEGAALDIFDAKHHEHVSEDVLRDVVVGQVH